MEKKEIIKTYCRIYRQVHDYYKNAIVIGVPITIFIAAFYLSSGLHDYIYSVFTFGSGIAAFLFAIFSLFNSCIIMYHFTTFTNKYFEMLWDADVILHFDILFASGIGIIYIIEVICHALKISLVDLVVSVIATIALLFKGIIDSLLFVNGFAWFIVTLCSVAVVGYIVTYALYIRYCVPKRGEKVEERIDFDKYKNLNLKQSGMLQILCEICYYLNECSRYHRYSTLEKYFSKCFGSVLFEEYMRSMIYCNEIVIKYRHKDSDWEAYTVSPEIYDFILENYYDEWKEIRKSILKLD